MEGDVKPPEVIIPIPKIEGYVIYNPKNGLFAMGGTGVMAPRYWREKPKIWRTLGDLKNHLHLVLNVYDFGNGHYDRVKKFHINDIYRDCLVLDINTRLPVDFDIYRWYLTTEVVQRHLEAGYVLKYVS